MRAILLVAIAGCAAPTPGPFPLRAPFARDGDLDPVSVSCRPDPSKKDPRRETCAPRPYFSPYAWDQIDNSFFRQISRVLEDRPATEAANANSLDEVADSAWFTNRIGIHAIGADELARGACSPDDYLPDDVPDGAWTISHGKDNGATPGFRVTVPGKGEFLLKADDPDEPERASAASVIGAAIYHAAGFYTSCEQIVYVRKAQLVLTPGLITVGNNGIKQPFDDAALDKVLQVTAHDGQGRSRMQASKWLHGVPLGPFRYHGTRGDDPNDVLPHEDRRDLRGSRLIAAWLNHWDAREQNSMDMWIAADPKRERSSPGIVRHYILDTSDVIGQYVSPRELGGRLGFAYVVDWPNVAVDLFTLGAIEHPWDRTRREKGRETFGYFSDRDFDPAAWRPSYPNPTFERMTERDGAWMARIIARFSPDDVAAIVKAGEFSDAGDAPYLTKILLARQRRLLTRYLLRLSPITDVTADARHVCAIDLARIWTLVPPDHFHYGATVAGHDLAVTATDDGKVCFDAPPAADHAYVIYTLTDGTGAGPLEIHTYDEAGAVRVAGLVRPEPR